MMEQIVQVKQTYADGTALVVHARQSACSGDCHKCAGCGAAAETILLKAENPIGADVGDMVYLRAATGPVLKAAAVLYLMPMALFFLGYLLGALAWGRGAVAGGLAFVAGICLAVLYDRKTAKNENTGYVITGFAKDQFLKSERKGDNELD